MSKCWLHDWEMIERISAGQIKANIEVEGTGPPAIPAVRIVGDDKYYIKKACLKCEKIKDTITPRIEVARQEMDIEEGRKNKAKEIINKH